jgi:hypothetical protein
MDDRCAPEACVNGFCQVVDRVECDDANVCTEDRCIPETGLCESLPLTRDRDGDGVLGPRAGFRASAPDACGDDCDDANFAVYPGAREVCDGADNDCNGVIDDGASHLPTREGAVRVSSFEQERAFGGAIGFDGDSYGLFYTGKRERWQNYFKSLNPGGDTRIDDVPITNVNADTFTGPMIWTGSLYGAVWEDARLDANYEIFFNRLDRDGRKHGADVRITNADDFSLHPSLLFIDPQFVLVWDDRRPDSGLGPEGVGVYGQRIDLDGNLIGSNVLLTPQNSGAEYPKIAFGEQRVGLVFTLLQGLNVGLGYRWVTTDFAETGPIVNLGVADVRAPSIVWATDRFVVAWEVFGDGPGDAIWGATISEDGNLIQAPKRLTTGARFARTHTLLSLGDRLLLIWADDRDGNYELYEKTLTLDLEDLSTRQRVTEDPADSLGPSAAFGPNGDVGVLFDDWRSGTHHLYFRRLECLTDF